MKKILGIVAGVVGIISVIVGVALKMNNNALMGIKLSYLMCVPYCLGIKKTTLRSSVMMCLT